MGSQQSSARGSERRLKFSSVRSLETGISSGEAADGREPAKIPIPLSAIREALTSAYVAVARRALLVLNAVGDERARRRAVALRRQARARAVTLSRTHASPSPALSNFER